MSFLFASKNKTFRPRRSIPEGTHQYDLLKHAEATLGSGNLRNAVMLPEVLVFNSKIFIDNNSTFFFF